MSDSPEKYIIGLTGNIATGKSLVRQMLVFLGAHGIDADNLAHRVIMIGSPGYQSVIDTFGESILAPNGQIDRSKLGQIVFQNHSALEQLEAIIHPLVDIEIDREIQFSRSDIFVIEAIKLLETRLREQCDTIWVVVSRREIQIQRLMKYRKMTWEEATQRIDTQSSQEEKISYADIVIYNNTSLRDTWDQVVAAWQKTFPAFPNPTQQWEQFIESIA